MAEEKQYTRQELEDKLSDKEKIFCHEYIVDWNKSRAARAAGYSENSAADIGYQISIKLYIKQYIEFIKNDLEIESGISKLRNLKELAKIAYSSIAHLHNTWITLKDFESLTDVQKEVIESTETKTQRINLGDDLGEKEIEYVKIKLYPKITAIQEINKMMGYNAPDKVDHTTGGEKINSISKDQEKEILTKLKKQMDEFDDYEK